jgi:hypothetical protein
MQYIYGNPYIFSRIYLPGKKIQLAGHNISSQYFGIDSFTVVPGGLKVIGKYGNKESELLSQPLSGYYRQKAAGYKKKKLADGPGLSEQGYRDTPLALHCLLGKTRYSYEPEEEKRGNR